VTRLALGASSIALFTAHAMGATSSGPADTRATAVEATGEGSVSSEITAELPVEHTRRGFAALDRPTTMAEFGFGWITLPGAAICVERLAAGCKSGDTSLMIDGWLLYRNDTRFAFGAGMTLGFLTTTSAPRQDPTGVDRDHRRGYFNFESIVRYYPYVGEKIEVWTGATAGLIVVSDRFASKQSFGNEALIGPRGVTIRTEGFAAGLAVGGAFALAQDWSLGATLRYGAWFLPSTPAQDPLNDTASLSGANMFFTIAVGIGYRISL
jgi:hypothetical protein